MFRINDAFGGGRVTSRLEGGSVVTIPSGITRLLVERVSITATAPAEYFLGQNDPIPFNPVSTIEFGVPSLSEVKLAVDSLLGEEVAVLVNDVLQAGRHRVEFSGAYLSSGTYFYRLQAGSYVEVKRFVLMKYVPDPMKKLLAALLRPLGNPLCRTPAVGLSLTVSDGDGSKQPRFGIDGDAAEGMA